MKATIDVPETLLDDFSKNRIKELESTVKRLIKKNKFLENTFMDMIHNLESDYFEPDNFD